MLQMLEVSYVSPTDTRGTRVKVYDHAHKNFKMFGYNYAFRNEMDMIMSKINNDLIAGMSYSKKTSNYYILVKSINHSFLTLDEIFSGL